MTKVNPKPANGATDSHGAPAAATSPQAEETKEQSSSLPLYLSIAALVAGLLSLGVSLKKRV